MLVANSRLSYREYRSRHPNPVVSVVGIHGEQADPGQLAPLCSSLDPRARVFVPQAPPLRKTWAAGAAGREWYRADELRRPEPETFARGLAELERFLRDVMERRGPGEFRPVLVGYRQGAVLALAAANLMAETLSGVAVVCGERPRVPDEVAPQADLTGLPVLLIQDPTDASVPRVRVKHTYNDLKKQGAIVELVEVEGAGVDPNLSLPVLRQWTQELLAATFRTDFNWEIGL